jgi:hypothetical protein
LEELWDALSPIAFHLKVSEKDMYAIDDADVAEVLETLIKENFDTPEEGRPCSGR